MLPFHLPCRAGWRLACPAPWRSCLRAYTAPPVCQTDVSRARAYCSNLLRHYDSPSFTLQAFIPSHARDAYLAIRAFNVDVARVAEQTSNAAVGRMRMQFWRDAVTGALEGTPPREPVAMLLAHAAESLKVRTEGRAQLGKSWFLRIVSEREKALVYAPFASLAALESYAENTYSTLQYLTMQAVPLASVAADHLASHVGKATGITAVLRGLSLATTPPHPNHHSNRNTFRGTLPSSKQGAVLLPLDVMAESGVKEEDVLRSGADAAGLRNAVFAVATRANDHLITARSMLSSLRGGGEVSHSFDHADEKEKHQYNRSSVAAGTLSQWQAVEKGFGTLMPAIATNLWLERLQKLNFDVFNPRLRVTDWRLPWRAYWAFRWKKL